MADKIEKPALHIKKFFFPDIGAKEAMEQMRGLTDEDKQQLAGGIVDGTYTY